MEEYPLLKDRAGSAALAVGEFAHASPLGLLEGICHGPFCPISFPLRSREWKVGPDTPDDLPRRRIDIGATELFVALPRDRAAEPVRVFATFTADLEALAAWLKEQRITHVAMESTGVYWIPVLRCWRRGGWEFSVVNAHHAKGVPGRKTDVSDAQWLQYLHSVGLLRRCVSAAG